MYGVPRVHSLQTIAMTPTLGALTGSCHSQSVIDTLNSRWGNTGGVIFGQPGDPYADRYNALVSQVASNLIAADTVVLETNRVILEKNDIVAITSEEELSNCPHVMKLPILLYPPVRQLFEEDRIDGYGYKKENLPDEDVYGRLINNGRVQLTGLPEGVPVPEWFEWIWKSDDPELSEEDLERIEATRGWLDMWLLEQMGPKGMKKDPTEPSQRIRKKRK